MTIKEARNKIGWSQALMSEIMKIPKRTIENWESGVATPPSYVEKLIVDDIERRKAPRVPEFRIENSSVERYAEICKAFAHESAEWSHLPNSFFTTDGSYDWKESSDNAHGGVDVSWAFGLDDYRIEYSAAERLLELLREEIQLAVDDGWDIESLEETLKKFNF